MIEDGKVYPITGKTLKKLLAGRPVHGVAGETTATENADGSFTVGLDTEGGVSTPTDGPSVVIIANGGLGRLTVPGGTLTAV